MKDINPTGKVMIDHPLPPLAEPVEWPMIPLDLTEKFRWLYCPFYDRCLTHAAGLHWEGFACIECRIFKMEAKEKEK